jgi:hypothetical protein
VLVGLFSGRASLGEVTVAGGFDFGWGEVIELAVETFSLN